ncbi:hypothetical protein AGMMS49921_04300 [Endomicrobiia bacterium]|nr:hypothetical protein AGMMS49921_04300 [Endomicrobiia bacterium]
MVYSSKGLAGKEIECGKHAFATVVVGGGCKYKISQNLELDGNIRYQLIYNNKLNFTHPPDPVMLSEVDGKADHKIAAKVKMKLNYGR